ncbi:hypothetical protein EIN_373080, partial [Entamoeba invadens IP1]
AVEKKFKERLKGQLHTRNLVRIGLIGRRVMQNVVVDVLSFASLFLMFLLGGLYFDRQTNETGVVFFTVVFTILQVIFPGFYSMFSFFTALNEKMEFMGRNNRDFQIYSGMFSYLRQLYYFSKKRSWFHLLPIVLFMTLLLFCLFCKGKIEGWGILVPFTVFTFASTFFGCFSCNMLPWAFARPKFETWWLTRVVPFMFFVFVSMLLLVLQASGVMDGYYFLCTLPLMVLIIFYIVMQSVYCTINLLSDTLFKSACFGCYDPLLEETAQGTTLCECCQCIHSYGFIYLYVVIVFVCLKFDGLVDWSFSVTIIPIEILIVVVFIFGELEAVLPTQYFDYSCECCYYIVDNHYIKIWEYPVLEKIFKFLCCTNAPNHPIEECCD